MIFIVDANNLCGKLGLLGEDDFDKKLISIIKEYNHGKGNEIILVFDGADYMGDRYKEDNITIIRTPKDGFYKSADDKIIELTEQYTGRELTIVTDDIDIKEKIKNIANEKNKNIKLEQATVWAKKIENFFIKKEIQKSAEVNDGIDLNEDEVNEINRDLLKHWK